MPSEVTFLPHTGAHSATPVAPTPLLISHFLNNRTKVPDLLEFPTWGDLVDCLMERGEGHPNGRHRTDYSEKNSCEAFSPTSYRPGQTRRKENAQFLHFGVLDLDHITEGQLGEISNKLDELSLAYMSYTTWSHTPADPCYRILFPFDKPVPASQWQDFFPRLRGLFGNISDEKCSDESRLYYVPACPPEHLQYAWMLSRDGEPLKTEYVFSLPIVRDVQAQASGTTVEKDDALQLAHKLKRSNKSADLRDLGKALEKVCKGEPFADKSENREEILFLLSNVLVRHFPNASAASLTRLFEASFAVMNDTHHTLDVVKYKMERAQEKYQEETQAKKSTEEEKLAREIRSAFLSIDRGRSTPYTEEELKTFEAKFPDGKIPWVVGTDASLYLFLAGHYEGPFGPKILPAIARDILAPAHTAGVKLVEITDVGTIRAKDTQTLLREYGDGATRIVVDLTAKESSFDRVTRTVYEAPTPLRNLTPHFDPLIDQWLRLLSGEHYDVFMRWLSLVPDLTKPLSILYLYGSMSAGKTLLANGLAGLWGNMPCKASKVIGTGFNEDLTKNPLILADEEFPNLRGQSLMADLREIVQAKSRPLSRKFKDNAEMVGCVRLILAANNSGLLRTKEALEDHDIDAIDARIFHLKATDECKAFLDTVDFHIKDKWAESGIACHVHAICERLEHVHFKPTRFGISGGDRSIRQNLILGSHINEAVCDWIISWLQNPAPIKAQKNPPIKVSNGKIYATSRIASKWRTYPTNVKDPASGQMAKALKVLSDGMSRLKDGANYYRINTQRLCEAAETLMIAADTAFITEQIQRMSDDLGEEQ